MNKLKCGLLIICLVFELTACTIPASEVSVNTFSGSEVSSEIEEYATGYSLKQIGLKPVFPEKVEAYPFEDHSPHMYAESGVAPIGLRKRLKEFPSLKADMIDFNGGWTMARFWWDQPEGDQISTPVMFLQAFKKSDIDRGIKVEYRSFARNDLCVEFSKEELMKYLWKETDDYYIIDFLDVYINDYRVFACEAALYHQETTEYIDLSIKNLDFNTYLGNVNDVRNELKDKINLVAAES